MRVQDRVEPALKLEDGRDVNRDPRQDEEAVEAGQDDQQVVERVLPHLPETRSGSWVKYPSLQLGVDVESLHISS